MNKHYSHINSAKDILRLYQGREPLGSFLKKYFSANKKFGSRDRKLVAHLCYCFFRLGKMKLDIPVEERILSALFLCSEEKNDMLALLKPEWNELVSIPVEEKCSMLNAQCSMLNSQFSIVNVFPWMDELSDGIDHKELCESFFIQPDLFIRLRPGMEKVVINRLQDAGIEFKMITPNCVCLPNSSKIDEIIKLDSEAVVQDYNSQQTGRFFNHAFASLQNDKPAIWDCCAGSGGKSIMTYDINPNIDLMVSDTRESILVNLKKRFQKAGIKDYNSFVIDLASEISGLGLPTSDIILCDAPCTGSGTWSRTPEQLYFFKESEIERYASLQKRIVSNVIPQLQPGGALIYITCSVFEKENEEIAGYMKENFRLELIQMEILKGYDKKADSMFVAVMSVPGR